MKNDTEQKENDRPIQGIGSAGEDGMMEAASVPLLMTEDRIEAYLTEIRASGVANTAVRKYCTPLKALCCWLGEDKLVTAERLQLWRRHIESCGYSSNTLQGYISTVNTFLRSCGYAQLCIPRPMKKDLTGQKFGYLTAIGPVGKDKRHNVIWRCKCKCGNEVDVVATLLITGNTVSCGCFKTARLKYVNRYVEGTELRASMEDSRISKRSISGYTGVQPKRGKWRAYIRYKGISYSLGTYKKMEDAVKARARAKEAVMEDAKRLYEETDHLFREPPKRPPRPEKEPQHALTQKRTGNARRSDNTSGYTGVILSDGKWMANIGCKGKRYILGYYDDIEKAIAVRKQAEQFLASDDMEKLMTITTRCFVYK